MATSEGDLSVTPRHRDDCQLLWISHQYVVSGNVWRDTCSVQRLYWNSVRTALTSPNGARTRSEECDPPNGTLRTAPSSSHPAGENAETQRGQGDPGQASPVPRCTRANVETGASPNSAPDTPGLHPTPTIIQGRESRWPSSINSGVGGGRAALETVGEMQKIKCFSA